MKIISIAGMAPIAKEITQSKALYCEALGLPLDGEAEYVSTNRFPGAKLDLLVLKGC